MKRQRLIFGILAFAFLFLDLWGYYESSGRFKRWMASYGHDVFLPMFLYFFNRAIWPGRANRRWVIALFVFAGATAFEFAQLGRLYSGTFDPLDIFAYAAGVTAALGLDTVFVRLLEMRDATPKSA